MGLLDRLFRGSPRWVRQLPPHLRPNDDQVRRLEVIRREVGAGDQEFYVHIASHSETTRRLQHHLYAEARRLRPGASEQNLLATVLLSRWISAQQHGRDVFGLSQASPDQLKTRVSEIAREYPNITALADAIVAEDERQPSVPLSPRIGEVARRITEILQEGV